MARILLIGARMHIRDHGWDWAISCLFFAAILIALFCAAVLQNPAGAPIP